MLNKNFCHHCGQRIVEQHKFCPYCGSKILDTTVASIISAIPQPSSVVIIDNHQIVTVYYKRLVNYIIDIFLIFLILGAITIIGGINTFLLRVAVIVFYYMFFEGIWQKTPGKWITKTKVIMEDGAKPLFFVILKRSLLRLVPFEQFTFLKINPIGFHDWVSKTIVVNDSTKQFLATSDLVGVQENTFKQQTKKQIAGLVKEPTTKELENKLAGERVVKIFFLAGITAIIAIIIIFSISHNAFYGNNFNNTYDSMPFNEVSATVNSDKCPQGFIESDYFKDKGQCVPGDEYCKEKLAWTYSTTSEIVWGGTFGSDGKPNCGCKDGYKAVSNGDMKLVCSKIKTECDSSACLFKGLCYSRPAHGHCVTNDPNTGWECDGGYVQEMQNCIDWLTKIKNAVGRIIKK